MHTVFDSADLPGHERVAAWHDITSSALVPTEIRVVDPAAFTARLESVSLGLANVAALRYTALSSRRTARLVRRSDPEHYQVGFCRAGRQGVAQNDRQVLLRPGELVLYDSSRPFEAVADNGQHEAASVVLQLPKRLLPLPSSRVSRLYAVPLPTVEGIGCLLAQFLVMLADQNFERPERDVLRLGHLAVDLVGALVAHHLDEDTPSTGTHALYLRVITFIDQNLHVPELGPTTIASAHGISVRYLHRIFQANHETGVAAYLRARRLDRCRRDLADPGLDQLTIASIAARWGFTRPADFSRLFRRETGVSPSWYRATSRGRHGVDDSPGVLLR